MPSFKRGSKAVGSVINVGMLENLSRKDPPLPTVLRCSPRVGGKSPTMALPKQVRQSNGGVGRLREVSVMMAQPSRARRSEGEAETSVDAHTDGTAKRPEERQEISEGNVWVLGLSV